MARQALGIWMGWEVGCHIVVVWLLGNPSRQGELTGSGWSINPCQGRRFWGQPRASQSIPVIVHCNCWPYKARHSISELVNIWQGNGTTLVCEQGSSTYKYEDMVSLEFFNRILSPRRIWQHLSGRFHRSSNKPSLYSV